MACQSRPDVFVIELDSISTQWYLLGIHLRVDTNQLDTIETNHKDKGTQRCLIELFKILSLGKLVSWNDIADALEKMKSINLADSIREKYVQTAPPPQFSVEKGDKTGSDLSAMESGDCIYVDKSISREFYDVIATFTRLVLQMKRALKDALQGNDVSIDDIQIVIQDVYELEPLSAEVATLDKVFSRMRNQYDFLNCNIIFNCFIKTILSTEINLQKLTADYTDELEKFKNSEKMKDLMKQIKDKNQKTVVLKTCDSGHRTTLKQFEKLANSTYENLYHRDGHIRVQ